MARLFAYWLMNLLRAVLLLWSMLAFVGWGFSGATGPVGNAMLVTVGAAATVATVATVPGRAFFAPGIRVLYAVIVLAGLAAIGIVIADALDSLRIEVPGIAFEVVGGLGLFAGLARLRRDAAADRDPRS